MKPLESFVLTMSETADAHVAERGETVHDGRARPARSRFGRVHYFAALHDIAERLVTATPDMSYDEALQLAQEELAPVILVDRPPVADPDAPTLCEPRRA